MTQEHSSINRTIQSNQRDSNKDKKILGIQKELVEKLKQTIAENLLEKEKLNEFIL
jgi:hypothetical protein